MFVLLPIAGFFYGKYYQEQIDMIQQQQTPILKGITPNPQPTNGSISCTTNADCPTDYYCTQAGPIVQGQKMQPTCWKKGYTVPL